MAGEPEQLGGISIDIGINDAQVEARLAALEARLARLVDKTYNVKVALPGVGTGKGGPGTPGGAPVQLNATLKIEGAAAVKQKIAALGNFQVPITLKLTQTEINRLKTQIKTAFESFSVPIKVTYSGAQGGPIQMHGPVTMAGPAYAADDEEVAGTGGSVRRSGGRGRVVSLGPRTLQRDTVTAKLSTLIDTLTKARSEALYQNAPRAALNRMQADIQARQRQLMVVESSPDDVSLQRYPELGKFASGTGTSRPRKRGLVAKPAVVRASNVYVAPTIAEGIASGMSSSEAYAQHAAVNFRAPQYYADATIRGPEALAAEAADRQRRSMGRTQRAMEGEGRPTERQYRAFDRSRLVGQSGRRRGPVNRLGMQARGFFEPFAPNQVGREFDPNGPYPGDPAMRGIAERFRLGGYGTRNEPGYAQLDAQGEIERVFAHSPERFERFRRAGISTSPGQPFRYGRRTLRIMSPSQLARRAVTMYQGSRADMGLGGISEVDRQKLEGIFKDPKFDPDLNQQASYGGGYKGVSTGFGPAARSSRDTPAGNRLNQQRVAESSYQEAVAGLGAFDRASLQGEIGRGRDKFEALAAILADPERRERGQTAPQQRRLAGAMARYRTGYAGRAGLSGFLGEDSIATPRSVYGAFVRKFATQYRADVGMRPKRGLAGLPKELQEQIRGDRGAIYGDQAEIEAAGNRVAGTERITPKSRERRRDYTPAETQAAAIQDRLGIILGSRSRLALGPGAFHILPSTSDSALSAAAKAGTYGTANTSFLAKKNLPEARPGLIASATGREQRRLRREVAQLLAQLPIVEAAARQEREGLLARGVDLSGTPVIGDSKVLSGDVFAEKTMASARTGRAFTPDAGGHSVPPWAPPGSFIGPQQWMMRRTGGGRRPSEPTPFVNPYAGLGVPVTQPMLPAISQRAKLEAGGGEQLGFGFGPAGPTGPISSAGGGPSGSVVPVRVVNFADLKGNLFMKGEKPSTAARAAEEVEEGVSAASGGAPRAVRRSARLVDQYKIRYLGNPGDASAMPGSPRFLREERVARLAEERETKAKAREEKASMRGTAELTQGRLLGQLRSQGIDLKPVTAEGRPFTGKSPERIQAEAEILEARALSPTRAFQTAIAAAAAKTLGGGGGFERRVKGLSGALNARADAIGDVGDASRDLAAVRTNLNQVAVVAKKMTASGEKIPGTLVQYEESLQAERKAIVGRLVEARGRRGAATADVAERRANLISPAQVVRGFAALGGGAIAGGIIFSAASQMIQSAIELMSTQAERAADALSGFANTTSKVTATLAQAVRGAGGDVLGGIAGAAAGSGISPEALDRLNRQGLANRAQATAAAQARVETSDLFRSAAFLGGNGRGRGGFDKALFEGTGGVFNSALLAPQPGVLERVSDDLLRSAGGPLAARSPVDMGIQAGLNQLGVGPLIQALAGGAPAQGPEETAAYVADLNEQLGKATSNFKVLTNATDEQKAAMIDSAKAIGQGELGTKLAAAGVAFVGRGGAGLTGTQFGQAASDLARGQTIIDPRTAFEQDKRGITAQLRQLAREQQQELNFSIPAEAALGNLANPMIAPGSTVQAANAQEQKKIEASTAHTQSLQDTLNKSYEQGNELLKQAIPPDLYNSIKETGAAIAEIQSRIAKAQAGLQAAEYNNQLRIAKRSLQDIQALQGKRVKGEYDGLGAIERQNVMLQRQSELLQLELQQRQINFQLAIAGFQTPGDTPEERAARRRDAQTQAEFAQKQLDIQKKLFGNQVKVFDIQNLRAAEDALASIGLLKQGRAVALDTAAAQEDLARLGKIQDQNLKKAGTYLNRVEKEISIASGEITKLEAAYGDALSGITEATIKGFIKTISTVRSYLPGSKSNPTPQNNPSGDAADRRGANGLLGITSGPTMFLAGEAQGEAVAIIKHPRNVSGSMGGGGGPVTIQINGPVVREERDIAKIADAVERVLNRRVSLLGLRN